MRSVDADADDPGMNADSVAVTTEVRDAPRILRRPQRPLQHEREDDGSHLRHVGLLIEPCEVGCRRHRETKFLPQCLAVPLQGLEAGTEHAVSENHPTVVGQQYVGSVDGAMCEPATPRVQRRHGVDDQRGELEDRRFRQHVARRFEVRQQMRQPHTWRDVSNDMQRSARPFETADWRKRSHVKIRVARRPAADRLFNNRVVREHRRERKRLGLDTTVGFNPANAEPIVK